MKNVSPDWSDPTIVGRNKEPARATFIPYVDEGSALKAHEGLAVDRESTPYRSSLNGEWRFHWAPSPADAPEEFFLPGYDRRDWDTIDVPSNWQLQGAELRAGIGDYAEHSCPCKR